MNKRIALGVIISITVLICAGCMAQAAPTPAAEPGMDGGVEREYAEAPAEGQATGGGTYAAIERLIVRDATMELVVSDAEDALAEINAIVAELDGYIVESNVYRYQEGLQASVQLRIPAESLDAALDGFRELATEVRREYTSTQEVTGEYVDLQASLRHLEAAEEKLLEFLDEAEDTEATLQVYARLEQIQAEIEQVKGRIQFLEQSAAMATVTLDLIPDELAQPIEIGGWHPEGTLRKAFEGMIRVMQFLVDAAIVILVLILPVAVVVLAPFVGLFFLVRAIVRRRRARKQA